MEKKIIILLLLFSFISNSCSSDKSENASNHDLSQNLMTYVYDMNEIRCMDLINNYRDSLGLIKLKCNVHVSFKAAEHNYYMIANNVVNHDGFVGRAENIVKILGAKKVSENVAYNYQSNKKALDAWIKSPRHKETIEGDFTHFGIAIQVNSIGRKYYTNIFVKL